MEGDKRAAASSFTELNKKIHGRRAVPAPHTQTDVRVTVRGV